MAVNACMFVDGIEGTSTSFPGAMDIVSFHFDFGGDLVQEAEGGVHVGGLHFGNLVVKRSIDSSSIQLAKNLMSGELRRYDIEIVYAKAVGDAQEMFFKAQFFQCMPYNFEYGGTEESPLETITVSYEYAKMGYNAESDTGGRLKGWIFT